MSQRGPQAATGVSHTRGPRLGRVRASLGTRGSPRPVAPPLGALGCISPEVSQPATASLLPSLRTSPHQVSVLGRDLTYQGTDSQADTGTWGRNEE